jgi:hypothetical protein
MVCSSTTKWELATYCRLRYSLTFDENHNHELDKWCPKEVEIPWRVGLKLGKDRLVPSFESTY